MDGAETTEVRATPAAAFVRAREFLRAGERLDMGVLAGELGISRATLYRWTGDREQLLADIVWSELSATLAHFERVAPGRGAERLTGAAGQVLAVLADSTLLRAFLRNERETGLRILTDHHGGVRPRVLAALTGIIEREAEAGYRPPDDPAILADGILSLAERWLYHGGNPDANPDPETGRRVVALLLREPS